MCLVTARKANERRPSREEAGTSEKFACGAWSLHATKDRGDNRSIARAGSLTPPTPSRGPRSGAIFASLNRATIDAAQKARGKVFSKTKTPTEAGPKCSTGSVQQ